MGNTEIIYIFMSKETIGKEGIEENYIFSFKSGFTCQHRKTNLKITF